MDNIQSDDLVPEVLENLLKMVYTHTGIKMNPSKKSMLQVRLRPRMKELGLNSYKSYIDYFSAHKEETQEFINLITTNETYFFRTFRVWDYFCNEFLPSWFASHKGATLKIWSGASSSGEEVYTIGVCCEKFRRKNPGFNYEIIGTDISTEVLAIADFGEYSGRSIEIFRKSYQLMFDELMVATGDKFKVHSDIKSRIKFMQHNLFTKFKRTDFDLVFLRNVLIYFEPGDQEKVLKQVSYSLIDNGTLIIGESESLSVLKTPFQFKSPLIYEKKSA